jgi:hypothetical protein
MELVTKDVESEVDSHLNRLGVSDNAQRPGAQFQPPKYLVVELRNETKTDATITNLQFQTGLVCGDVDPSRPRTGTRLFQMEHRRELLCP